MGPISTIKSFLLKITSVHKQTVTPTMPSEGGPWDQQEFKPEQPFTDSWESVTWRMDEVQPAFTDGPFP